LLNLEDCSIYTTVLILREKYERDEE
jgi:hypothetical protein